MLSVNNIFCGDKKGDHKKDSSSSTPQRQTLLSYMQSISPQFTFGIGTDNDGSQMIVARDQDGNIFAVKCPTIEIADQNNTNNDGSQS